MTPRIVFGFALVVSGCIDAPTAGRSGAGSGKADGDGDGAERVLLVANAVSGTVSLVDLGAPGFASLGTIDVAPDLAARLETIEDDPVHWAAYQVILKGEAIPHFEPSGGQRLVDDVVASPDGTTLYVSRGNLGDVAAFDLTAPDHPMRWRTDIPGYKADHAALSPDGARLIVSATMAIPPKAVAIDTQTGAITGEFATGTVPHQNDFSADGTHIYNGNIGIVSLPAALDFLQGPFELHVVDAATLAPLRTYTLPTGIRPTVITPDETTAYLQQSYLNGLVKLDLTTGAIVASLTEPTTDFARTTYPTVDDFPHKSAHHGLALSRDGRRLCDVGTIDNTVSIVSTDDLQVEHTIDVGNVPYWATTSGDLCLVSVAGDGAVAVIDYATGALITRIPVGTFPQRNRVAMLPQQALDALAP